MKRFTSPALLTLVVSCIALFASANSGMGRHYSSTHSIFADSHADGGLLVLRFSPTLGINFGVTVRIDGYEAGPIARGHVFRRYLAPGRHRLEVTHNGRVYDALDGALYVRPGETYSYVIKNRVNQVVLQPSGVPHH